MERYEVKVGTTGVSCNSETKSEYDLVKVKNNNEFVFTGGDLIKIEENEFDFSKIYTFDGNGQDLMFRECDLEMNFKER
jgi:uncharacterized Zn finger protein